MPSVTPKKLLIASALPTFQPFRNAVCTMSRPITAPRKIFPPNTLAAEMATMTSRKANAVFDTVSRKAYQSVPANPGIALPSASTSPIIRPDATMAGRIGTKTSPSAFSICFHIGCFAAAAA